MDVPLAWSRLEAALPASVLADLRPGASDAELDAAERSIGAALPPEARAAYALHDGQRGDAPGVVVGLRLFPIAEVVAAWSLWRDIVETSPDIGDAPARAVPEGVIRPLYVDLGWLPLVDDGAGNHVALDLHPGPLGARGQVITFGSDEPVRYRLAGSLPDLLLWLADAYGAGRVVQAGDDVLLSDGRDVFRVAADLSRGA